MNISYPDLAAGQPNCADVDPDAFFRHAGSPCREAEYACTGCPFSEACFSFAVAHDVAGFWGGTSEAGRRKIRKLLDLNPISTESSMASLFAGLYQNAKKVSSLGNRLAGQWAELPLEDALAARDEVLHALDVSRKRGAGVQPERGANSRQLTDDQVREIRTSTESSAALSRRFNVADSTIRKVRSGLRYAEVAA